MTNLEKYSQWYVATSFSGNENKVVEKVTYYCAKTKQTVTVVKGSQQHRTLKNHKMWKLKTT